MRLTLGTLLAYLDNCLEAGDAQELARKIDESQFAANLVERIRGAVSNPRLGAPRVTGQGPSSDANSMAEYIDSTLSPERMPGFEKKCLESDMWLAEVSSCHQIVTLALTTPAEIPATLRERAYRVGAPNRVLASSQVAPPPPPLMNPAPADLPPAEAASAPVAQVQAVAAPVVPEPAAPPVAEALVPVAAPPMSDEPVSKVPEYLRAASGPKLWPLALTLVAGFLLTLGVLRLLGRFDETHPLLGGLFGQNSQVAQAPDVGETNKQEEPASNPATKEEPAKNESTTTPAPDADATAASATAATDAAASDAASAESSALVPPPPASTDAVDAATARATPATAEASPAAATPARPMPPAQAAVDAASAEIVATPAAPPMPATPAAAPADAASPADVRGVEVGRFTSEQQMLARWDDMAQDWLRVAANAPLVAGQTLLSLPNYRPQLLLNPGLQITLAAPSRLHVEAPGEDGAPRLHVEFGKAILIPPGGADSRIHLDLGGIVGTAVFANPDAALALEAESILPFGADPEMTERRRVARLMTLEGVMRWIGEDGAEAEIPAGQALTLISGEAPRLAALEETPTWIDPRNQNDIDRRAASELELELPQDRGLSLAYAEYSKHRRVEYRAIASRALVYLGQFGSILGALDDRSQKSSWSAFFDTLREAVSYSPQAAKEVREAMAKSLGPQQGQDLYRMTWGYSTDDLRNGEAAHLVSLLESQEMPVRVFAIENLRRITGKTMTYRPEVDSNRTAIQNWNRALNEGQIRLDAAAAAKPAEAAVPSAREAAPARPPRRSEPEAAAPDAP